jgi:hypothetical protein
MGSVATAHFGRYWLSGFPRWELEDLIGRNSLSYRSGGVAGWKHTDFCEFVLFRRRDGSFRLRATTTMRLACRQLIAKHSFILFTVYIAQIEMLVYLLFFVFRTNSRLHGTKTMPSHTKRKDEKSRFDLRISNMKGNLLLRFHVPAELPQEDKERELDVRHEIS